MIDIAIASFATPVVIGVLRGLLAQIAYPAVFGLPGIPGEAQPDQGRSLKPLSWVRAELANLRDVDLNSHPVHY